MNSGHSPALEGRLFAHALEGEGEHGDEQVEQEDDRHQDEDQVEDEEDPKVEVLPAAQVVRFDHRAEVLVRVRVRVRVRGRNRPAYKVELGAEEGELHGGHQRAVPLVELSGEPYRLEAVGGGVDEVERAVEGEDEVGEEREELEDVVDEDLAHLVRVRVRVMFRASVRGRGRSRVRVRGWAWGRVRGWGWGWGWG